MKLRTLFASLSLLLLSALLLAAARVESTPSSSPNAADTSATRGEALEGVVRPSKEVIIYAPVEGLVKEVPKEVQEGSIIKEHDLMTQMDNALQVIVVESARVRAESTAAIDHAKATYEEAIVMVERTKEAFDKGAANELELRRSKLQQEQARAEHQRAIEDQILAKVNVRLEEERLARYQIKAPFTGKIIRIEAKDGATLRSSDPVMTLAALDPLEAHFYLPVWLTTKLETGKSYRLQAFEPINKELTAKLKVVDSIIDTASETVRCVFTIENPEQKNPAGFKVRLIWPQQ